MDSRPEMPANECDSPHIDAPVWPWAVVGWSLAGIMTLLFLIAWLSTGR